MTLSAIPSGLPPELHGLLAEFRDLADLIAMPDDERAAVAGLPVDTLQRLAREGGDLPAAAASRCARRLHYSLPLLRRIVENDPALRTVATPRGPRPRRGAAGLASVPTV